MEALVSPSCQPPLLLVEASSLRAVRPSERDAAPSDTRLIWDVSVPSSASTSRDAFCWPNANAVAAVPTSAANEAEVTNADLREAALAASRMARRLIGATSFSLSTTSGASPTTAPPSASCAIRTALAVWEPRFAVNNALDRLNCACETWQLYAPHASYINHSLRIAKPSQLMTAHGYRTVTRVRVHRHRDYHQDPVLAQIIRHGWRNVRKTAISTRNPTF